MGTSPPAPGNTSVWVRTSLIIARAVCTPQLHQPQMVACTADTSASHSHLGKGCFAIITTRSDSPYIWGFSLHWLHRSVSAQGADSSRSSTFLVSVLRCLTVCHVPRTPWKERAHLSRCQRMFPTAVIIFSAGGPDYCQGKVRLGNSIQKMLVLFISH